MPNIDKEWVDKQLTESRIPVTTANFVRTLLVAWSEIKIDNSEVTKSTVELFSKLSLGIPLIEQRKEEEIWVQAMAGSLKVGDEVLVLPDAFEGELAPIHNGRRGRVVAVRYGDIIVNSTDGLEPVLSGTHYNPVSLQKLVRK